MPPISPTPLRAIVVDDDPMVLGVLTQIVQRAGFVAESFLDPLDALRAYDSAPCDLVVSDISMPRMSGHDLVHALRERSPDVPIIVVTAQSTIDNALRALREGSTAMILKPFDVLTVMTEIKLAMERAQTLRDALRYRYTEPLLDSIALSLAIAIEERDIETSDHCHHIGVLAERTAGVLGLSETDRVAARVGGYLHDVGKIGVADRILFKSAPLDPEERREIERHPVIGARILGTHESLGGVVAIVRHHHERWDGTGYPDHLVGADIPINARIVAVADVFDALTNDRPYRARLPIDEAWRRLREASGTQFDPRIVDAFAQVVDQDGGLLPTDPPGTGLG